MKKSLSTIKKGKVIVDSFICDSKLVAQLIGMGIINGTKINVIKNDNKGQMIITVKNANIAISKEVSEKIYIK